ncbi:MAG TPA: TIGR01459 family HAD-type hydrolase [Paracoccaceae bacterium]|nr:TIGR01459 family HAD-type hydrolase [Paracoccaceae bacterium]
MTAAAPRLLDSLAEIAGDYDALFCDLWGCLHDGVRAYPAAVEALRGFRAAGGVVVLMTNAPRPRGSVIRQLDRLQVPEDCWDRVVSSGDAALASVRRGEWGRKVVHIGDPKRDEPFFEDAGVERVSDPADADSVVVTGLRDDHAETPEDYRDELRTLQLRRLPMLSANPDVHVDVGPRRVFCAGALAVAYEAIGGETRAYGKPHPPIYDIGRREAEAALGRPLDDDRILCLGDGVLTDVKGAVAEGLDCVFVTGGLAAERLGADPESPDPERLAEYLAEHRLSPRYAIGRLR